MSTGSNAAERANKIRTNKMRANKMRASWVYRYQNVCEGVIKYSFFEREANTSRNIKKKEKALLEWRRTNHLLIV